MTIGHYHHIEGAGFMPKVSVYVTEEQAKVWEKARRLLRFHHNKGLGQYLTPSLEKYVDYVESHQDDKK